MASRDFLGLFGGSGGGNWAPPPEDGGSTEGGESDEIELGLGLSLGGRFGTDRSSSPDAKRPRLARATSVASACSVSLADADADPSPASPLQLLRTSSLPTDTEEDRWRRREMQSRRRLEARRKMLGRRSSVSSSSLPGKTPAKEDAGDAGNGTQLRRSTGSQGSSSANQQGQGLDRSAVSQSADARSSTFENANQGAVIPPSTTAVAAVAAGRPPNGALPEQPPLRTLGSLTSMRTSSTSDMRKSMMEDMPMVSSKVDGPNGKKIDGFLYRYRKGGEGIRIVCVCHGSFLTPAEFVKHAGGGDVSNPLRHIVVSPSPSALL